MGQAILSSAVLAWKSTACAWVAHIFSRFPNPLLPLGNDSQLGNLTSHIWATGHPQIPGTWWIPIIAHHWQLHRGARRVWFRRKHSCPKYGKTTSSPTHPHKRIQISHLRHCTVFGAHLNHRIIISLLHFVSRRSEVGWMHSKSTKGRIIKKNCSKSAKKSQKLPKGLRKGGFTEP